MSWEGVFLLAVVTTLAATLYRSWEGMAVVGGWWLLLLTGRFFQEWSDRYGWPGRLRTRRERRATPSRV